MASQRRIGMLEFRVWWPHRRVGFQFQQSKVLGDQPMKGDLFPLEGLLCFGTFMSVI